MDSLEGTFHYHNVPKGDLYTSCTGNVILTCACVYNVLCELGVYIYMQQGSMCHHIGEVGNVSVWLKWREFLHHLPPATDNVQEARMGMLS